MLVLSRRPNEEIQIGPDVVITIIQVNGDKVRIGITAPRETVVHRMEVIRAIAADQAALAEEMNHG